MDRYQLIDHICGNFFGRPQTLKSYKAMRNYLEQLDKDQLKSMIKDDWLLRNNKLMKSNFYIGLPL